jgi:serine/threonine protein kinase
MTLEVLEREKYSFAVVIWSVGCVLYELVTSKVAFFAITKEKLNKKFLALNTNF